VFPLLNYIPSGIKICILRQQESEEEKLPLLCETGRWARPRESKKDSEGVGERPEANHSEGNEINKVILHTGIYFYTQIILCMYI